VAQKNIKNIVVVMFDTLRPDHLGCYGNKWIKTPNLDMVGGESMVFDRAVAEALPTVQVRRALWTGMRVFPFKREVFATADEANTAGSFFLGVPGTPMPGWAPMPWYMVTMSEILQGLSFLWSDEEQEIPEYRTALITDDFPLFSFPGMNFYRGFGHWDFIRGQAGDRYGTPVLAKKWDLERFIPTWFEGTWEHMQLLQHLANTAKWQSEEDHFAPQVFSRAIEWLDDSKEDDSPFFLLVDCWDPHEPWDAPQHYVDIYDPGYKGLEMISPYYGPTRLMTEKELHHMRMLYAAEVTMVDTWFGKFMDRVRELGLLDNSLLIVTSDHGHVIGEHGISGKLPAGMYDELVNCVLMVRRPDGVGAGQRSNALVQHHDIATTIVNCSGARAPYEFEGKDLMPLVEGKADKVRDYATCGFCLSVWCRDDDYVLICRNTGDEPQLFDMRNDPEQNNNIASDKPKVVKRMFDLVIEDAGGPVLPNWRVDPLLLKVPGVQSIVDWTDWSPFREWKIHGE